MPLLDCPIPKQDWLEEVERDGILAKPNGAPAKKTIADAGPWEDTVREIVSFQELGNDWDGFGAKAPTRELLESAIGLAYVFFDKGIDPPHCVVPGLEGSVNLEWQNPDGAFIEVEIDQPFHAEVMLIEPGKPARFWTLPTE